MKKEIITITLAVAAGAIGVLLCVEGSAVQNAGIAESNVTRIEAPDQVEPVEHPDFVREVFEAEKPDGTNIVGDANITDNGFTANYTSKKVADGDASGASYWEGDQNNYPNILTFTYDEAVKLHAVCIMLNPDPIWGKRTQSIEVQASTDGENYETLVEGTDYEFDPNTGNQAIIEFDETELKGIQLIFNSNSGANAGQAAEVELYSN